VYTTLEAPMEKTQGIVVAGRCTMVSFQGLKAGTVESILNIWSLALRSASLSKLAASTGAFSSGHELQMRTRCDDRCRRITSARSEGPKKIVGCHKKKQEMEINL
jgi:hypothetical protein